jgi:hypothetical protein
MGKNLSDKIIIPHNKVQYGKFGQKEEHIITFSYV